MTGSMSVGPRGTLAEPRDDESSGAADDVPALKSCCARLYESEIARWLLGDSFHPGGLELTARLGEHLELAEGDRVLDVASGPGASAFLLAERFGCEVIGIDYSEESVRAASAHAVTRGLAHRVDFRHGDAEALPFADGVFDALVCECAFCTFPDKTRAAREFARVLRRGGRVGLADLTRASQPLAPALQGLLAWAACIADAQPLDRYIAVLQESGLRVHAVENHAKALREMVRQVAARLLTAEALTALNKLELPGVDFAAARALLEAAADAVERGELGYALLAAVKTDA
jgi:arsenite methyltransferase